MIKYQKQGKCVKCKRITSSLDEDEVCNKCNKLMVNNPKGYNKHIKNSNPTVVLTQEQEFKKLSKEEQHEWIRCLGNKNWKDSKELTKNKSLFTKYQKIYFGFDFKE
jgi:hypothetical protein